MKPLMTIFLIVILLGCADTHKLIKHQAEGLVIRSDDTIYVAVPSNGVYGERRYSSSGMNTAQIIYSEFSKHANSVKVGRTNEQFAEALATAREDKRVYLIFPTILHWEDRATEWSSIPDKVEVKIEVVDTASGKTVSSVVLSGKSGLATLGGDHPQDLLPEPIKQYVLSLY